jgi:hypothetical protein
MHLVRDSQILRVGIDSLQTARQILESIGGLFSVQLNFFAFDAVTPRFQTRIGLEGDMDRLTRRGMMAGALVSGCAALGAEAFGQDITGDNETEALIDEAIVDEIVIIGPRSRNALPMAGDMPTAPPESAKSIIADGRRYLTPIPDEAFRGALAGNQYWSLPEASRPKPKWAERARGMDTFHLGDLAQKAPSGFDLDASTLAALAQHNHFTFQDDQTPRLFGLRGCALASADAQTDWAKRHSLRLVEPDHVHLRCLIGIWRPTDGEIKLYRASTVPQVSAMYKMLADKGWGASLLPTGFYRFAVGTHLASRPASRQRAALRNASEYVVLRTTQDLAYDPYEPHDVWTFGAAHNIHSTPVRADLSRFGSNGCQVIPGGYSGPNRTQSFGVWRDFQVSTGLIRADGSFASAQGGVPSEYMLLTGYDAALAARGGSDFNTFWRLRPGSKGAAVQTLQTRLISEVKTAFGRPLVRTGKIDLATSIAILVDNKHKDGINEYAGPIVVL